MNLESTLQWVKVSIKNSHMRARQPALLGSVWCAARRAGGRLFMARQTNYLTQCANARRAVTKILHVTHPLYGQIIFIFAQPLPCLYYNRFSAAHSWLSRSCTQPVWNKNLPREKGVLVKRTRQKVNGTNENYFRKGVFPTDIQILFLVSPA
jgi:hypothetical protein